MSNEHKKPPKHLGNVETDIGKLLVNNHIANLLLITQIVLAILQIIHILHKIMIIQNVLVK